MGLLYPYITDWQAAVPASGRLPSRGGRSPPADCAVLLASARRALAPVFRCQPLALLAAPPVPARARDRTERRRAAREGCRFPARGGCRATGSAPLLRW